MKTAPGLAAPPAPLPLRLARLLDRGGAPTGGLRGGAGEPRLRTPMTSSLSAASSLRKPNMDPWSALSSFSLPLLLLLPLCAPSSACLESMRNCVVFRGALGRYCDRSAPFLGRRCSRLASLTCDSSALRDSSSCTAFCSSHVRRPYGFFFLRRVDDASCSVGELGALLLKVLLCGGDAAGLSAHGARVSRKEGVLAQDSVPGCRAAVTAALALLRLHKNVRGCGLAVCAVVRSSAHAFVSVFFIYLARRPWRRQRTLSAGAV